MATKLACSTVEKPGEASGADPNFGACADFVKFCKEQYLHARSAETFIRVLHNRNWEAEVARIREAMRPEIDAIFAPVEKALANGNGCRDVMAKIVVAIEKKQHES